MTARKKNEEIELVKTLLVVSAWFDEEKNKAVYDWEFPDNCDISRLIGILEIIKQDLLSTWFSDKEEEEFGENE